MKKRIVSFLVAFCLVFSNSMVFAEGDVEVYEEEAAEEIVIEEAVEDEIAIEEEVIEEEIVEETASEDEIVIFDIKDDVLVAYYGEDEDVIVPDGVKAIGKKAFAENQIIVSVKLPETVKVISESAFQDCASLIKVEGEKVEKVEKFALLNCSAELKVAFAEDAEIDPQAFAVIEEEEVPAEEQPVVEEIPAEEEEPVEDVVDEEIVEDIVEEEIIEEPIVEDDWKSITDLSAAVDGNDVVLTWNGSADLYRIVEIVDGVAMIRSIAFDTTATVPAEDGEHAYAVIAVKGDEMGEMSAPVVVVITDVEEEAAEEIEEEIVEELDDRGTIKITTQPKSYEGPVGSKAVFTVAATGTGLKYRWQLSKNGGSSWADLSSAMVGYNTNKLTIDVTEARDGYNYRCKITDSDNVVKYSSIVSLTVAAPITIVTQPEDFCGALGSKATFSVEAEGDGLKYRWYLSKNNGETWAIMSSATAGYNTPELTVDVTNDRDGYAYRCRVTDVDGNIEYSEMAVLTVSKITITKQPENYSGKVGTKAVFTTEAKGDGLKYRWYLSKNNGSTWAIMSSATTGYNTPELTVDITEERNGYAYRCRITDVNNVTEYTDMAVLSAEKDEDIEIIAQPKDQTAKIGETVSFKVEAKGKDIKYRWYLSKDDGASWAIMSSSNVGYNTPELKVEVTEARDGYAYRCRLVDANNKTVYTEKAVLNVDLGIIITKQPENYSSKVGEKATFKVEAKGKGLKYRWCLSKDKGATWAIMSSSNVGYNTPELTVDVAETRDGYYYRCRIIDENNETVYTEGATLDVIIPIVIVKQPEDFTGKAGEKANFTVEATGKGLKYRWYLSKNNGATWSIMSSSNVGYNTKQLTVDITADRNGYSYYCRVYDSTGAYIDTEVAVLHAITDIVIDGVTYGIENGTAVVKSYNGSASSLTVRETVTDSKGVTYTVTKIGDSAFENNTSLRSIDLPDTIQIIGKRAFAGCTNLAEMN